MIEWHFDSQQVAYIMSNTFSNTTVFRLKLQNTSGVLSKALQTIAEQDATVGAIDIIKVEDNVIIRDITIDTHDDDHANTIGKALNQLKEISVINVSNRTFLLHLGGKIETKCKIPINNRDELSMAYTPGVAKVCTAIYEDPDKANNLTIRHNTIAVLSDGSAVLGLGNIGPLAALPVMEGKAMLLKEFANVDAFPICVATQDTEEIIQTAKNIAPNFGGINLEDISAPRCFEIEKRLKRELDIPVFHDDQHGTAAVMMAALLNALKLTKKELGKLKVVFNGVGAAGNACKDMLLHLGVKNIIGCDRKGAISCERTDLTEAKKSYLANTNPDNESGSLYDVISDADVFIGLSSADVLKVDDLKKMNKDPIVFAMANPTPEIMPEVARPHVAIMATGRSDYPNQINNLLAFPGIFRGALDCRASDINQEMQVAAAYAIANIIDEKDLSADYIIPSVFNPEVAGYVAAAVKKAAQETGVARR